MARKNTRFKLSMLTAAELKAHNSRAKKIDTLLKQGQRVAERAMKRFKK